MSRVKKAEQALIDSKKTFPTDECKAKIARRYGPSAVALSGPCQGSNLAECVCEQLTNRWDEIGKRFAFNKQKAVKVALKLAETLSVADDTERCEEFLRDKMKFEKKAASEITSYLRAYAMDELMDKDINEMVDEVETEEEVGDLVDEPLGEETMEDESMEETVEDEPIGGDENLVEDEPMGEESVDMDLSVEEAPLSDGPAAPEGTVNIEVPVEVAKQVLDSIQTQLEGPDMGETPDMSGTPDMAETPDMGGEPSLEEGPAMEETGIPGEPSELQEGEEKQIVVSEEPSVCEGCGAIQASEGIENTEQLREKVEGPKHENETPEWEELEHKLGLEEEDEHKEGHEEMTDEGESKEEDKAEKDAAIGGMGAGPEVAKWGQPGTPIPGSRLLRDYCEECEAPIRASKVGGNICNKCKSEGIGEAEGRQKGPFDEEDDPYASLPEPQIASQKKTVKTAQADEQVVGHEPVSIKEKQVEAPKPINEGNFEQEGYSANGKKIQDGGTMKSEQKFDAKTVDKSEVSGGSASLMGKDESYPEGTPKVPAGSAPIKNEELTGGDVATKGTVIATIRPEGILVTAPDGKKFLAKASIRKTTKEAVEALTEAIKSVQFDGDAKKYAANALKACKKASKAVFVNLNMDQGLKITSPFGTAIVSAKISNVTEDIVKSISSIPYNGNLKEYAENTLAVLKQAKCIKEDGCVHIDTGKLEGEKFTNDGEKKPEDGGVTSKGNGKKPNSEEGQTKIDTGKKEDSEFTNDGKKEPEAASNKTTKTAAEKKVEDPKPISEGNLDQEGYSANEKKFQDGKPMGNEQKFDAQEVNKSDVSAGDKSLMGNEEPAAKEGPKVPAGGPKIGNEELTGGDVSTKGTVIADNKGIALEVREARLKAASAYVADLLRNGEISESEYTETLEKFAQMPVQAIIALATSTRMARERAKTAVKASIEQPSQKTAGIAFPLIAQSSNNEKSLKDRLVENFRLTKDLNRLDSMK